MSDNPLIRQLMEMQAPPVQPQTPEQPVVQPEIPAGYRKVSPKELEAILANQQSAQTIDIAALAGQFFPSQNSEPEPEKEPKFEATPQNLDRARLAESLFSRRAALPVLGAVAIGVLFLAGRSDAFASFGGSEDISALTLDIFDDFEDCETTVTSATISSKADVIWGIQLADGKPGLMEPPVVTSEGANRHLQAALNDVNVDFAMCQNLGADDPVSIEDGRAIVDLNQVALVPSFTQGESQGVETITVTPPAEGAEALYTAEEAARLTEANKNPSNHRVIMNILRRDSLEVITTDETCGLPMQGEAKAAIISSLREQASTQGVDDLNVEFKGSFLHFDDAYETGKNIEADFSSPVLISNDEATADDDLSVFTVENVVVSRCEPVTTGEEQL